MKTLIVLAHPEARSFNAALVAQSAALLRSQGHEVRITDLYSDRFDPSEHARHFATRKVPDRFFAQTEQRHSHNIGTLPDDVGAHIADVLWADLVILQFPLWWFGMPAILKGWMDRTFAYGALYSGGRRFERGVCNGKRALLSVTAGSSADACAPDGREGDTRLILWPVHYALHYVGFTVLEPIILTGIGELRPHADRRIHDRFLADQMASHARQLARLDRARSIPFNGEEDWDERHKLKASAPVYSPFIRHVGS